MITRASIFVGLVACGQPNDCGILDEERAIECCVDRHSRRPDQLISRGSAICAAGVYGLPDGGPLDTTLWEEWGEEPAVWAVSVQLSDPPCGPDAHTRHDRWETVMVVATSGQFYGVGEIAYEYVCAPVLEAK